MGKPQRRRSPRRDHRGQIGIMGQGKFHVAQCRQIGEGGAMVFAGSETCDIQEGDTVAVTFFLPITGGIVCRAVCLYKNEAGAIGLNCQELSPVFKKKVRDYVAFR